MGEVVNVATLFTDLVDSTALAFRLGPEQAEQLRREHFALLRDAVPADDGRLVKNVGDGLMFVFGRASAAVGAAVAMQGALELRNRSSSEPLRVRIGIAVGEADLDEDGDVFGLPVVVAARLCNGAEGGQILVTDLVRALCGDRGAFDFVPVGARELHGLGSPVEACEVAWEPSPVTDQLAIPIPVRLARAPEFFAGRVEELDDLTSSWKRVRAGEGALVVLAGEAGIGKTSLVGAFGRRVHDEGGAVLYGRCDEDLGVAYQPWRGALEHLVEHADEALLSGHVDSRGGDLVRLVPGLARRLDAPPPTSTDPEAERFLLFGAVADLLARAAPLVLVLDDLHWADRPSLQLLRHVVSADAFSGLLIVATYRPTDVDDSHPLVETLAALHRTDRIRVVDVAGLDDVEVLELMEAAAGHRLGDDGVALRDALVAETSGNPFFVGELLRHLAETGAIVKDRAGRWLAGSGLWSGGLPVSVRHVVARRVGRLGPQVEEALRTASVIGREFELSLLAAVTGSTADELVDLLEPAVRSQLVSNVSADRFAFVHALVEHALYDAMTPARRARLHRRVAEAIEVQCGSDPGDRIGELAHHWSEATVPADAPRAVDYACRAGDRALSMVAPDEAARWYRRALELLDDGGIAGDQERRKCEVMVRLGTALRQAGDPSHRELLLDAARLAIAVDARDLLVAAALANNRGSVSANGLVDSERTAVLDAALGAAADADHADRARLSATLATELTYSDDPRRFDAARTAIEIARRCADPDVLLDVIALTDYLYARPNTFDERNQYTREAVALSDDHADPVRRWTALVNRRSVDLELGDRAAARRHLAEAASIIAAIDLPYYRWAMGYIASLEALLDGDLTAAEVRANEAFETGSATGQLDAFTLYGGQILSIRYHQGRMGELSDLLVTAIAETPAIGAYHAGLPAALAQAGEHEEARAALRRFVDRIGEIQVDLTWLATMTLAADAAVMVGDRRSSELLYGLLAPHGERVAVIGHILCFGPVAHRLGCLAALLGRDHDARQHLETALGLATRLDSPLHRAAVASDLALVVEAHDAERAALLRADATTTLDGVSAGGLPGAAGRWHP